MFCTYCGNKVDEKAYVCVNCGRVLKNRSEIKIVKEKKDNNTLGIVSMIFGIVALFLSLMLYFHDISSVGMYTDLIERVFYALDFTMNAIMISIVSLILSLVGKRNTYSNISLTLSLISFFFIITEFIVVIIY